MAKRLEICVISTPAVSLLFVFKYIPLSNTAADTDKLVTIKGLVIRATPVIPDMKTGKSSEHDTHLLS